MKRLILLSVISLALLSISCVSKKKFSELQDDYDKTKTNLETTATKLSACEQDKKDMKAAYEA